MLVTRQQRLALLPATALALVALTAFVLGQVVPGAVVLAFAAVVAAVGHVVVRRSVRLLPVVLLVGVAVVGRTGIAVADGYLSERLAKCHEPSADQRRRVAAVAQGSIGDLVAVRHNGTDYVAGPVDAEQDPAIFGLRRGQLRAVNDVARDHSTAEFDYLFGLGGVLVIEGPSKDGKQEGRLAAIARVTACASR